MQPAAKTVAGRGIVPKKNPETPSTIHQTGTYAFSEGVSEPRHQTDAQGDCVRGAEVMASEESAAEAAAKLCGPAELPEEPYLTPSAFI